MQMSPVVSAHEERIYSGAVIKWCKDITSEPEEEVASLYLKRKSISCTHFT